MAYTIATSNKPQPEPTAPLFNKRTMPNGRDIWVSLPQPDKLSVTIPITKHLYGIGVDQDVPVAAYANGLGQFFAGEQEQAPCHVHFLPNGWRKAVLKMGPENSTVLIQHDRKGENHNLRLECNPRKLGPSGFAQLASLFGDGEGKFNHKVVASHGKVTRMDLAVDVVRMHVSEIVLAHKKEGKRALYVAKDGRLETIYLHRQRPAPKPKHDDDGNPVPAILRSTYPLVRIYDLARHHLDHGMPTPFGPAEVTRIEIVTRPNRVLSSLQAMTNPFRYLRAGFVSSQHEESVKFAVYQAMRRTTRRAEARALLNLEHPSDALDFSESVTVPNLANGASWLGFPDALALSGLQDFMLPPQCN